MHLPLETGFKLEAYEITAALRRLGEHNFYSAVSADGSRYILNEYIPGYCTRGESGTLNAASEKDMRQLEASLAKMKSDLSLIIDSPVNEKCRVKRIVETLGTIYAVCDAFDGFSVAEAVEGGDRREFGYCIDLIVILCDLTGMALKESLYLVPDKFNVVINKDDFMLMYTLNPAVTDKEQVSKLAMLLYFLLNADDYQPVAVVENAYSDDGFEHPHECYDFLLEVLAERFKGGLREFRAKLYGLYYPSDEPLEQQTSALRLGIALAVIALFLLFAGGALAYFLMSKFFIIKL